MPHTKFAFLTLLAIGSTLCARQACAEDHLVLQRFKAFGVSRLSVKSGETVKFLNLDGLPHNVFSKSPGNVFDVGVFPKGGSRDVTFNTPGVVEVRCAVHPEMTMTIEVTP